MKEIWVKIKGWDKELLLAAIESGANGIWIDPEHIEKVKRLSKIPVISQTDSADIVVGKDLYIREISKPEDQESIVSLSLNKPVLVRTLDWRIIPLENLVARSDNIWVEAKDLEGARLALTVLEKGVKAVVIEADHPKSLRELLAPLLERTEPLKLIGLKVQEVKPIGMGHRVCVDTCAILEEGEGLLVGSGSNGLFLIHGETIEGPYAAPRPFRVNAGAVHSYVLCPGFKTRYLSELHWGDEILVASYGGNTRVVPVGRCKIEKRPLIMVSAMYETTSFNVILQNAETIRLVFTDGRPVSVVDLKAGDEVIGLYMEGGRHFGHRVEEWIKEA